MSAFARLWHSLDVETQEAIRAKARWERMTLRAVLRDWWPDLYARLKAMEASK